ncbi:CaiB/BaiF CoA transferase family protein [Amycolatopsis jejuensis]|uniref:CaiB/BaiF CoA transferase family protein n=1 Tax=Amycolatopsis jejuensis TaxID=330084 RepID=UPI0005273E90|nr:CoA transferase [Amycolatopsis jejuensis]
MTRRGPLDGIRVLDLTRHMAGPYGAAMLGDYGAEVIKAEPVYGDQARAVGRDYLDGESGLFLMWNRSKRSIALDYRSPEGREVLERLISSTDVFLHNFRPVSARNAGLDFEGVRKINPRVVYASVNGFGTEGPWADRPATDPVIQAMSGIMSVTGERGGHPVLAGVPIADFTGAMLQVIGVLMALRDRDVTGDAQEVQVSMLAGLMSTLTTRASSVLYGGYEPEAMGSSHSAVMPYQAFQAKDGYVMAGTWGEAGWPRFCSAIDLPELEKDPRFATNQLRLQHREELESLLAERFRQRTRAEWDEAFARADALFGHIYPVSEALHQEQAGSLVREVDHTKLGRIKTLAPPIAMSSAPDLDLMPPPVLGEHSVEVLKELGYPDAAVADLVAGAIVVDGSAG